MLGGLRRSQGAPASRPCVHRKAHTLPAPWVDARWDIAPPAELLPVAWVEKDVEIL